MTKNNLDKEKNLKAKEKIHSNKIRIILEEIGMSQQELADICLDGRTSHLSKIINGQRRCISLPIALKIANVLKRPVEEIFIYKSNDEKKKD